MNDERPERRFRRFVPFLLSAIISAAAMLLADYSFLPIQDTAPNSVHFYKLFLLVPGIAFGIAINNRHRSFLKKRDFWIIPLLLIPLWSFTFGVCLNAYYFLILPSSGFVGAYAIWWLLHEGYEIPIKQPYWKIGIAGLIAAIVGFALVNYLFAETGLLDQPIDGGFTKAASASVVFLWQIIVGVFITDLKPEFSLRKKIDQIGTTA